jgi:hypothetical protein
MESLEERREKGWETVKHIRKKKKDFHIWAEKVRHKKYKKKNCFKSHRMKSLKINKTKSLKHVGKNAHTTLCILWIKIKLQVIFILSRDDPLSTYWKYISFLMNFTIIFTTKKKVTADFSLKTMQVRRQWNIFTILENKAVDLESIWGKKTFKKQGEINTFKIYKGWNNSFVEVSVKVL